jgi:hypothetical protein
MLTKDNFSYRIKGGESRSEPGRAVWFFMYNDYYREWPAEKITREGRGYDKKDT